MRRVLLVCAIGISCAPSLPKLAAHPAFDVSARYRTVHVDSIAPGQFHEFEAARRDFVEALRAANASDQRGLFLEVDGAWFFTLRPFQRFADLDVRRAARERAVAPLGEREQKEYDRRADAQLVFPHRNEVWTVEPDLSYAPGTGALDESDATFATLTIEAVKPTEEAHYERVWQAVRAALSKRAYPLTRIAFSSVYGDGRVYTMWLAHSEQELNDVPNVDETLKAELGPERAARLVNELLSCVLAIESHRVVFRRDLSAF